MVSARTPDLARYAPDPVLFAEEVLSVRTLTPDQTRILRGLTAPPYRVLAKSGHNIGKTFAAAVAVVWWYYTRPESVVITTAPTERDVVDLLWSEVRTLVRRANLPDHFIGPAAPAMWESERHWAKGYTARKGESFQGRHHEHMLFVFDEAEGVEAPYWRTTNTMFQPDGRHAWLCPFNPTTTTSQTYQEESAAGADGGPKWAVVSASSLDHPNVTDALAGRTAGIPGAVSLAQVNDWLGEWFERIDASDADPEIDIEFPAGSGVWYRPEPEGESRVLGRRPSAGTFGVWSERLWRRACAAALTPDPARDTPELGCDVARYGDDRTEIHARCGPCSLDHEDHGGWDTTRTADRLMGLAGKWAAWATSLRDRALAPIDPKSVPVKVDDTGVGGGVTDILAAGGYAVVPVNSGEAAHGRPDKYPRVRDELWFAVRDRARAGRLDLSRLGAKRLAKLQTQALAPTWKPTADRRRQVESKEDLKKRLKRSPDGLDALNLAFYESAAGLPTIVTRDR